MSSEKRSLPFRQAVTSLVLGMTSMSFTLLCLFIADALIQVYFPDDAWLLYFLIFLFLELPAILIAIRGVQVGNTTRKDVTLLRDERLIMGGLFLCYLALTIAGGIILFLPFIEVFSHAMRRWHF